MGKAKRPLKDSIGLPCPYSLFPHSTQSKDSEQLLYVNKAARSLLQEDGKTMGRMGQSFVGEIWDVSLRDYMFSQKEMCAPCHSSKPLNWQALT
uniref:putative mucosal pentraxin homolog n=1 Tax=Odobenus rosmarus divergens TaxID=9708 RepID=UPI00063CD9F2|nr:PREDICTED: putative mucosal pentraxin homolog [Odobenus rosmarus divergens]